MSFNLIIFITINMIKYLNNIIKKRIKNNKPIAN